MYTGPVRMTYMKIREVRRNTQNINSDRYAFNLFDVSKEWEGSRKRTKKKEIQRNKKKQQNKVNMTCVFYRFFPHERREKKSLTSLGYIVKYVVLIDTAHTVSTYSVEVKRSLYM